MANRPGTNRPIAATTAASCRKSRRSKLDIHSIHGSTNTEIVYDGRTGWLSASERHSFDDPLEVLKQVGVYHSMSMRKVRNDGTTSTLPE